jgi:NAD(P)-dependent dehydrogenase (short-subunit alcohol dehydrogenase family)
MPTSDSPVAIVTGAGRGLGREHALALARAGYAVVVNDLGGAGDGTGADASPAGRVVAEIEALGGRAVADGSDVADWLAAADMIDKAVTTFGRLDALVNNAGVLRDRSLANFTEDDWDISIRVNLKGTAAPLHHAARYWRDLSKQTGAPVNAAVVNTSSASGLYCSIGQANYAAAKAGIAAMSVVAARELGRYGVRVNAVAPVAATRLTDAVMNDELKARFDPTLVSPLVVYLLSAGAKDVTGRVFEIGGDAVVVVDTPRPVAGFRAEGGRWTAEALTKVAPGLVAQLPKPEMTAIEAGKFMKTLPLAAAN